ncbi:MAG TPA: copper amine oxidase N-terminal domain-containing protein [Firmicutes bacterium]|nr:copper amine oxidase N-terminal domain-containing protein [Bacillota bacterium]
MRYFRKAASIVAVALVLSLICSSLAWAAKPPKKAVGKGNNKANVTMTKKEGKMKEKETKATDKLLKKEAKEAKKAQKKAEKAKEKAEKAEEKLLEKQIKEAEKIKEKELKREEEQLKAEEKAQEKLERQTAKQNRIIELNNILLQSAKDDKAAEILEELCALEPTQERFKALKTLYKTLQKGRPVIPELFVNGERYQEKVQPIVRYGRTLVPLRALAARLKADVAYDEETKTITMVRDGYMAIMGLDNNQVTISDADGNTVKEVELDVTPLLDNNSTFVPLRALAEIFGAQVTYDDDTNIIVIEDPDDEGDIEDEDDEDLDEDDLDTKDELDDEDEDDEDETEDANEDVDEDELDDADEETEDVEDDTDDLEDEYELDDGELKNEDSLE